MRIIGVTGNIGSGKTTVAKILESEGAHVINADLIARNVLRKNGAGYAEAVEFFGTEILHENGEIDRRHLADIVFSDREKLLVLNSITHKHVRAEIDAQIREVREKKSHEIICLDVPLLFEAGLDAICDITCVVDAPYGVKVKRVMERDGTEREAAEKRLESQTPSRELKQKCDVVIENDEGVDELKKRVKELL